MFFFKRVDWIFGQKHGDPMVCFPVFFCFFKRDVTRIFLPWATYDASLLCMSLLWPWKINGGAPRRPRSAHRSAGALGAPGGGRRSRRGEWSWLRWKVAAKHFGDR